MAAIQRRSRSRSKAAAVGRRYVEAILAKDLDGMAACWAADGVDRLVGQAELHGPDEVRGYFSELFAAFPDGSFEVIEEVVDGDRYVFRWRFTGTFAGAPFMGLEPTGRVATLEGCDVLQIADDRIQRNDAFVDGAEVARQLGVLPPKDSPIERRMTALSNRRTKVEQRLFSGELEQIADGVWLLVGGLGRTFNVYFLEDEDGVAMFDAGAAEMASGVATAGTRLGGITKVILGHGHCDHRGTAGKVNAPVICHPDEVADVEGDGGFHYFDTSRIRFPVSRALYPTLLRAWDGGPVKVSGTINEGDEAPAGFRVVHFPGHAPGMIGLHRESDGLVLCSDTIYTLNVEYGVRGAPRVPHEAFNLDTEQARESVRKLADLDPQTVWPGHARPVTGDVRGQLLKAVAAV
jgi:hydroxyacylglutathione hydrolase